MMNQRYQQMPNYNMGNEDNRNNHQRMDMGRGGMQNVK